MKLTTIINIWGSLKSGDAGVPSFQDFLTTCLTHGGEALENDVAGAPTPPTPPEWPKFLQWGKDEHDFVLRFDSETSGFWMGRQGRQWGATGAYSELCRPGQEYGNPLTVSEAAAFLKK